ncbi:substrate-binding domain-containing protein [Saccharothrix syringae]|uniref:LacI family transcriptional regulator n=1 Tax=Saccharothrix syringae TaxID=103733 RepID=A0A5Q0GZ15_SACSY|nr:substrate-binding domain-containing protein [Saccharothrix syringae]QFZ19093.1 LacI family transcriptional regulator [Saccharothrix syringae]
MCRLTLARPTTTPGRSGAAVSKVVNRQCHVGPAAGRPPEPSAQHHDPTGPLRPVPLVELVLPVLNSAWAMEVMRGVVDSGLDVVMSSAAGRGPSFAGGLVEAGRAGVLLVLCPLSAAERHVFARAGMPVVLIDPVDAAHPDLPSVAAANRTGGVTAAKHLLSLGHRRIGVVGGPRHLLCGDARLDGFRTALGRAGVALDPALVRHADFSREGAYREARDLLTAPHRPTAVFAANDEQALGVLDAARAAGLSVPGDLSVVGFDDLPAAEWSSPALTTVRQPLAEMGRHAGWVLADLIAGRAPEAARVELATELVVRSSTGQPRVP